MAAGEILPTLVKEDDGWHARWRMTHADNNPWIDDAVRSAAITPLTADAENQRHATLHDAWLAALRSRNGLVNWDDAECRRFAAQLKRWAERVTDETPKARQALVFAFSELDGVFAVECAAPRGKAQYLALGEAARIFGPLRMMRSVPGGARLRVELSHDEAGVFLKSGARALAHAGFGVDGCAIAAEITAFAELEDAEDLAADGAGEEKPRMRLKVRVAGEEASAEEIRFLLEQGSSLVFFRNRWIEVDRDILRQALRALEKDGGKLSRMEAVAFAQGIGAVGSLEIAEARAHGWLRGLLNELRAKGEFTGGDFRRWAEDFAALAPGFSGKLRPYQARGVAWLHFLTDHGFGALLADDMGLGKTVQTIAWICLSKPKAPVLVVVPLSLLANWKREIAVFAPSLKTYVHHGEKRHAASGFARAALGADIVLTSYTLYVKDYSLISETPWAAMVLDEAQSIKNADTRLARAVKALGAPKRLALTGTPVENSASDIWSLEEYLNPGFLPDRKSFRERFERPLSADPMAAAGKRLRRALEPFMLRRLKTDADIAAEIGEKREVREFCALSPKERAAYEAALAAWHASEHSQGDIFALINRLKLSCDGMVVAKKGEVDNALDPEGGKLMRLLDLLESIFASGESALVFTQYAKVGERLVAAIEAKFGERPPFMHGALTANAREEETARFNAPGPRAYILSLRTGGLGLNLVKATHVIHYDRWWNPAVEAQATDRAHRIGQKSMVLVHLFIAAGTIEENVDAILERKSAAAGNLVTSGEKFLASMSADEFERTVALE